MLLCAFVSLCFPALSAGAQTLAPGNYCVSCHASGDSRLARAAEWRGDVATTPRPCPGLQAQDEQLYYVERQLLAASRLAPGSADLTALNESYLALLDAPRDSVDAFAAEAQAVGYKGGKVYAALNAAVENRQRQRVLIVSGLVTLFLLVAFAWGLRITLRIQPARARSMWRPGARTVGALGLVVLLFSLPLFREAPAAVATSSAEEQAVQAELDKSSRAGDVAERAMGRAWMLGRVAATWAKVDPARGQEILAEALAAESAARAEADALWGRSQAGQEAAVGSVAGQDEARLIAEELLAVRNRAWALRLIAEEWATVDAEQARAILRQAEGVARANPTLYGQVDLAAIVATAKSVDPARVIDAAPVSLGGGATGGQSAGARTLAAYAAGDYQAAWTAAAEIGDEWERARAQTAIAVAWGNAGATGQIQIAPLREFARAQLGGRKELPADPNELLTLAEGLPREADKAEVLRAAAVATGDAALFDRALKMAAAARVRGDALAPARASLALARDWLAKGGSTGQIKAALAQAYELASKISVKYK
jgi:hypothetical protein